MESAISYGLEIFGENRVQEAKSKFEDIKRRNTKIKLHLTGPLQSNKVKQALSLFDVFHTLDREKLLKELVKFPEEIRKKSTTISKVTDEDRLRVIGNGSGFFINNSGYLVSNYHVIEICQSVGIPLKGQVYPVKILASDIVNDLIVGKVDLVEKNSFLSI